jgi:hypothetical protein
MTMTNDKPPRILYAKPPRRVRKKPPPAQATIPPVIVTGKKPSKVAAERRARLLKSRTPRSGNGHKESPSADRWGSKFEPDGWNDLPERQVCA